MSRTAPRQHMDLRGPSMPAAPRCGSLHPDHPLHLACRNESCGTGLHSYARILLPTEGTVDARAGALSLGGLANTLHGGRRGASGALGTLSTPDLANACARGRAALRACQPPPLSPLLRDPCRSGTCTPLTPGLSTACLRGVGVSRAGAPCATGIHCCSGLPRKREQPRCPPLARDLGAGRCSLCACWRLSSRLRHARPSACMTAAPRLLRCVETRFWCVHAARHSSRQGIRAVQERLAAAACHIEAFGFRWELV